jgi:hypothetical protein
MPLGPGRYDDLLTAALASARRRGRVDGGILIVFGEPGKRGFECQTTPELMLRIPEILRHMAEQIEAGHRKWEL